MKTNKVLLCSVFVLVLVGIFWLQKSSIKLSNDASKSQPQAKLELSEEKPILSADIQTQQIIKAAEQDTWISEGVRLQMADVSQTYAENIRYPKYSKPLHKNDWNLLNPRAFIPKSIPLDFNEGMSAAVILSEYIVNRDENLDVSIQVSGGNLEFIKPDVINLYLSDKGKKSKVLELTSGIISNDTLTYSGNINKAQFVELDNSEVMLTAELNFNTDDQAKVSAAFKLMGSDATLTSLNDSYVEGAHLMIPASFDIAKPGSYRVEANLFDKASDEPISHLNSSFLLSQNENTGLLKIHASTLRSKGCIGPYILTDFNITRRPEKPGDTTGYGHSKEDFFTVKGFDFSLYSEEDYIDPKNQQRLEFLQKMAGIK